MMMDDDDELLQLAKGIEEAATDAAAEAIAHRSLFVAFAATLPPRDLSDVLAHARELVDADGRETAAQAAAKAHLVALEHQVAVARAAGMRR